MAEIDDVVVPKKRVTVSFAGDDDVVQFISSIKASKGRVRSGKKKETNSAKGESDSESDENTSEEDSSENDGGEVFRPSAALATDEALTGDKVFGFRKIKTSSQLNAAVNRSVQALTPGSPTKSASNQQTPTTPKSILKKSRGPTRPESDQVSGRKASQRLKNKHKVASSSEDSVSSEDEDYEDTESDASSASSMTPQKKPADTPTSKAKIKPRGKKKTEDETVSTENVEAYFDAHSSSKVLTSDRTLSRLETPRMDHQALAEVLKDVTIGFQDERRALYEDHRQHFNKWMYILCHGYNLIFHGLGSKRPLIEEFRDKMLKDLNQVVVNGYFPSLTIKNILCAITDEILEHEGTFRSPIEQCDFIRKHFECGEYEDFFLIIHNIDGTMLRSEKTQTILSLLAQIRGFHIIASIDHINAPLMWDNNKCSRFNWMWYDVTSYEPYSEETSYENSLLVQQSGVLALSSLTHVLRSLPTNARGIFMLLVKHQLEHAKDNTGYQGLSFPDLYQKCREDFLVNSDITLRTQLTEFKDHKLIKLKKGGVDGLEYLHIPLDTATLKEFVEQQESEDQT